MLNSEQVTLHEMLREVFDEHDIELPEELVPYLSNVVEHIVPQGEKLFSAQSPGWGDSDGEPIEALFIKTSLVGVAPLSAMLLNLRVGWDGSGLLLVGEYVPPGTLVFPNLRVMKFSRPLNVDEVGQLNRRLADYQVSSPTFPAPNAMSAHAWPKNVSAALTWKLNGGEMPALAFFVPDNDKKDEDPPEKQIDIPGLPFAKGPLVIDALLHRTDSKSLHIYLHGGFTLAGQLFRLDGLGVLFPLKLGMVPKPALYGAELLISRVSPPLSIVAMLRYTGYGDNEIDFGLAGLVKMELPTLTLLGAAAWSRAADGYFTTFLYVEALLASSLFGPPAFTVTGLAGGFGINSMITPPTSERLSGFPLLTRLDEAPQVPGDPDAVPPPPMSIYDQLAGRSGWVRPEEGSFWIAAGLNFTTFRFIETKALAIVEVGNRLNVMIIGRTSITLPRNASPGKKVHARLNIDLRLAYLSDEHQLSLDVAVAPGSFLFTEAAELTGGIAVYLWTGGGRGGDFVITLGGYHPQFEVTMPQYYPRPARLGFRWEPCSRVVVQASGYTALTPGAVMFGGALAARYEKGMLSAWFTAYLDALIQWKPFYLDLAMGISIGVAATVKIAFVKVRASIEVGIDLQLWTPPTGGRVSVKVWFIGFSFDFGSARIGAPPVPWSEFQMQLPAPTRAVPTKGALLDVDDKEKASRDERQAPLLVSTAGFSFETEAAIPASQILVNGTLVADGDPIDIRPMKLSGVVSRHLVTVTRFEDGADTPVEGIVDEWRISTRSRTFPRSMWGTPLQDPEDALGEAGLLPAWLNGLDIEVPPPEFGSAVGPFPVGALGFEAMLDGDLPSLTGPSGPAARSEDTSIDIIASTIAAKTTVERRTAVHQALARLGVSPGSDTDSDLSHYADLVGRSMTSAPLVVQTPEAAR